MTGSQTGPLTEEQQIAVNFRLHHQGVKGARILLGLPEIAETGYTPQIGQETLRAQEALLSSVPTSLPPEARTEQVYSRISSRIPAGYKERLDADPQAKAAFMMNFFQLSAHVEYMDRFYQASQGATPAAPTPAASARNYTQAQRDAILAAMNRVSSNPVQGPLNNSTAQAGLATLTTTARSIATALRMNVAQTSDAQLGEAIRTKITELRRAYMNTQANPGSVSQAQVDAYFKTTYGFEESKASKVASAINSVAATGAFMAPAAPAAPATPATPAAPAAPREITPDTRTLQAMNAIRTQVFPALDIRSRGTDVASFRQDFNTALVRLGQILKIPGDANAVRAGLTQKLNELASSSTVGTARTTYNTIKATPEAIGGGERAAELALGALLRNMDNYEQLPQAIKDKPSLLLALLDQKDQLNGHLQQIYASNILTAPQIVPAQAAPAAAAPAAAATPAPAAAAAPAAASPAQAGGRTLTAEQIAAVKTVHESLYGAATGTFGNAEALASLQRIQQEAAALAGAFQIEVTPANLPQLGAALRTKVQQHRTNFATTTGSGDQAAYLANLRLLTGRNDITPERILSLAAGMDQLGTAGVLNTAPQGDRLAGLTPEQLQAEAAAASVVVEGALMKIGNALGQAGGGFGGMISGLAGFKPPTTADHIFDEQSQDALHLMLMGLKKIGGDKNADGTYTAAIGRQLLSDILTKPEYEMVRKQYGIAGTYKPEHVRNMQNFLSRVGQEDGVSAEDLEKVKDLQNLFDKLNILERANKLNNEKAKSVTFMGTIMDKISQFLPESMKTWLKNFFENDKFGQMIAGVLNMFGFPVQRLWGGQAPGSQQVRQTVRDGYYRELEAVNFDHAALKTRILSKLDDSVAFKAVNTLLFPGQDREVIKQAVIRALDKAALERDPNKAADVFADEMVREGERYKALSPVERENYLQQVRQQYMNEVRSMPGVPAPGAAPAPGTTPAPAAAPASGASPAPASGAPQINPGQVSPAPAAAPAAAGVPQYTEAQLRTVSDSMRLVGMSVPASGLTREGAKTAIEQIHAQTSAVLTKMGIDAASNRYRGSYDDIGQRVATRLAEERRAFFTTDTATEAGFNAHLKTKFGIDNSQQASNLAKAFVDIQKSGAMNLGAPQVVPAQASPAPAAAPATPSADGVTVQAGDKRFELVFTPDRTTYPQGPMRYSYGRVGELQNILSQNARALELSTRPQTFMTGSRGTDTMTRSTCMALEELAVRAQLAKGVELSAVSHRYDEATITAVTEYMRNKGLNQQDIDKFVRTVRDLEADMKSTNPRDRNAGAAQQHSVWDQSYIRNQVSVRAMAPAPAQAPATAAPATAAPADRYPGIRMSPENELPPGMTIEQLFEQYKRQNSNPDCPNQAPLIIKHDNHVYAGVVIKDSNTFKVIELDGYLDPAGPGSRRQTLNDSDYAMLRDNYRWHNNSKDGVIAFIDNMLCLEPKAPIAAPAAAPAAAAAPPAAAPPSTPPVRDQFRSSTNGPLPVPRNYWELPRLSEDVLEGLDKGCLNARELKLLYDTAIATREIRDGGALLTRLSPEDKARLGGDMIISVRNTSTKQLEHRLVNFEDHKIKIGGLTENYSRGATIRRLDDFLNTQYDQMAMTVSTSLMGNTVSQSYARDHAHTVDDALRQLFMPTPSGRSDVQRYYNMQREYESGENAGRGEQGFMTRQMYRGREQAGVSPYYRGSGVDTGMGGEHAHGSCDEFNSTSGRRLRRDYEYEQYRGPGSPLVRTMGRIFTGNIGDGNRQILDAMRAGGDQQIIENMGDCRTRLTVDPVHYYERGGYQPGSVMDRTPGIVDPPR